MSKKDIKNQKKEFKKKIRDLIKQKTNCTGLNDREPPNLKDTYMRPKVFAKTIWVTQAK